MTSGYSIILNIYEFYVIDLSIFEFLYDIGKLKLHLKPEIQSCFINYIKKKDTFINI